MLSQFQFWRTTAIGAVGLVNWVVYGGLDLRYATGAALAWLLIAGMLVEQ